MKMDAVKMDALVVLMQRLNVYVFSKFHLTLSFKISFVSICSKTRRRLFSNGIENFLNEKRV